MRRVGRTPIRSRSSARRCDYFIRDATASNRRTRRGRQLVVVAFNTPTECHPSPREHANTGDSSQTSQALASQNLPSAPQGVPVVHLPWRGVLADIAVVRLKCLGHERVWLDEVRGCLTGVIRVRSVADSWTYCVVPNNDRPAGSASFKNSWWIGIGTSTPTKLEGAQSPRPPLGISGLHQRARTPPTTRWPARQTRWRPEQHRADPRAAARGGAISECRPRPGWRRNRCSIRRQKRDPSASAGHRQ